MPTQSRDPGEPVHPDPGPLVGGRYRLRQVLGRGGMGVVWAAREELLNRAVAVKEVVPPHSADDAERRALRARTMREARTAARISAEGAVAIYDVIEHDGRPWIVMEQLPPRTLQDEVDERGGLPVHEVAAVGLGVLSALSTAHAAGVLHRDVKPANVLFRGDLADGGHAVLGDFGIAHFDGDSTLTSTGMVMGSPAYVAPERARGLPASAASDLWSLGATLWTALEARSPFERDNAMATLTAVITEDAPVAPHAGPLAPVLEGLLRKDPRQRLDAATAQRLLGAVLAPPAATAALPVPDALPVAEPVGAAPTAPGPAHPGDEPVPAAAPALSPVLPPRRRSPWLLPLLVVLGLVGAMALGALLWPDAGDPQDAANPGSTTPQDAGASSPASTSTAPPATSGASPSDAAPGTGDDADSESSPDPAGSGVPAGFERYEDPTGFSVAVPAGWDAEREGPRVYLRDPASSAYLLVDQTDEPEADPVADWQQQETVVSQRLANYERVGEIERVDFRGWAAADWGFVFGEDRGTRVLNRNVVTAPDQAHALYWSVPTGRWEELLPVHDQVMASFVPAG